MAAIAHAENGVMPIDHTQIFLPDGRKVETVRCGTHCHCLVMKRDKKSVHRQCYEEEFDRLWDYAFFVPVRRGRYTADIDGDGNFEIGIATWDGGNNIANRFAIAFSVKGDRLIYFGRKKFNLEYGEFMYE